MYTSAITGEISGEISAIVLSDCSFMYIVLQSLVQINTLMNCGMWNKKSYTFCSFLCIYEDLNRVKAYIVQKKCQRDKQDKNASGKKLQALI